MEARDEAIEKACIDDPAADKATERPAHWREKRTFTLEEMKAFWKQKKQNRKERQREARKDAVAELHTSWEALTPEEKEALRQKAIDSHEERRRIDQAHADESHRRLASSSTPTIVFDLSFVHVMNDRDCRSTMSQLKFSYSILKRCGFLLKPFVSSFDVTHSVFSPLATYEGFKKFPFPLDARSCVECFPEAHAARKLIFLTADTDEVLSSIEPDYVYVVGAFVDHNVHKGLTKTAADKAGIRTARLPLVEHMNVGNLCKVLTINHVVDALATFLQTNNWKEAFAVLPTRRSQEKKKRCSDGGDGDESADDSGDEVVQ
ncbi:tRNA methyltransferase, putative [Bodo saltans]|uniref:tRNA (guanine(9)-N(1))-methyltransferase n=1 Tax=Bodo saltans TaxID=75058 RepID=A0A0S4JPX3_BODSA|nr:tRNA methyltransferase, putative [Bodo saltans]|eukprot:CUG91125.1 tRNA methyltransferase, putative [Bodo saltans]